MNGALLRSALRVQLLGDRISMSTIAEVNDLHACATRRRPGSRGKASRRSRERSIETGASRDARLRAWEMYESLPMPTRTDEEWRRTDLRGLKLDRLRPAAGVDEPGVAPLQALEEAGVEDAAAQIALGPNAGVVVQRDAVDDPDDARSGARRQGRHLHRSRHRRPRASGPGRALLHDPGGAASTSASSRRCTPPSGRAARSSTCRRASRSSCRSGPSA